MRKDIKAMQIFIDSMVGIPKFSYPAKKNAPRPKKEFASIQLIEQYHVGLPTEVTKEVVAEDGGVGFEITYLSAVRLRFRITVVETSGLASTLIANGWFSEEMKRLMIVTGYGYLGCKPISLEDAQLEKDWEARQGFSVELSTTRSITKLVNNIGQVTDIVAEYYEDNTYIFNIEVNP